MLLTAVALTSLCCLLRQGMAGERAPLPIEIVSLAEARNSLDQATDTLRHDDNSPTYAFRFPDAYGDDWRNQRFIANEAVTIQGVLFAFPTRHFAQWTSGTPDLIVRLWPMGEDSLPVAGGEWLTDTLAFGEWSAHVFELDSVWTGDSTQFVYADIAAANVELDSGEWFHAGYSAALDAGDSLAILADDGIPETSYASEWWDGRFLRMCDGWRGVNFFIRVIVQSDTGLYALRPGGMAESFSLCSVYPNPFNGRATITFEAARPGAVRISVFDLLGRERMVVLDAPHVFGVQRMTFDGSSLASGKYFVRILMPDSRYTVPVVLVK
ncbi:MAG: T9SS type A sorting domain-containing protein [bacterium]|nr:T9SS type A sorting domain-containing protein [bacterium]